MLINGVAGKSEHEAMKNRIKRGGAKILTFGLTKTNFKYHAIEGLSGEFIIANFDNDQRKWGVNNELNIRTYSPERIADFLDKADAVLVYSSFICPISHKLEKLGVDKFYWAWLMMDIGHYMKPTITRSLYLRETLEANFDRAKNVLPFFSDGKSLEVLNGYMDAVLSDDIFEKFDIENRLSRGYSCQYFPKDIPGWKFNQYEVFVDAGAWDGDSIRKFRGVTDNGKYTHIYAFEPDIVGYSKLLENCKDLSNISFFKSALYSSTTPGRFNNSCQGGASHVAGARADDGFKEDIVDDVGVDLLSLDDSINDTVTFIKMDIEGSEFEALRGASRIISTFHPKLAICIYHKMSDIWEIPELLHDLAPSYSFYARLHSEMFLSNPFAETVLYAIE
jgi:FkbM family methyltransferase